MTDTRIVPIVMPKWGLSMKEGKVTGWLVEDGTKINPGDAILEVETDKIAGSVEASDGGVLSRRVGSADTVYPVKALLGVIADASVPDSEIDAYVADYVMPAAEEGEEDQGPKTEIAETPAGALRYAKRGERRRDRDPHPRLRRRSRQLAVQHRCPGRGGDRLCARSPRPWAIGKQLAQPGPCRA